ncbi:ERF family protein [Leisingera sp. ANG-M7]|uniref:ERF family protein n=1 Tax=Leisingera sp. ANG-M7 TaxID=1577902 RepID=UPI00068BC42D|nr:ERF family protein [Leisingera sp. ANG-M7]
MNQVAHVEPQEAALPADPMVCMIERVVMNPDLPMERVQAMFDLRERQLAKEAEQAFNAAFAAAMAEMPDIPKSGENKHLKRKYSTLDDLIRTARPVLAKHGLSLNWQPEISGDQISMRAIVRHSLGHSIEAIDTAPRDKSGSMNHIQGGGSTQTYLKRFTGFAILGLSSGDETDDDGQAAGRGEPINAGQYDELCQLIKEAGITEEIVCTAEKLSALHDLPAQHFSRVAGRLRQTIKDRSAQK